MVVIVAEKPIDTEHYNRGRVDAILIEHGTHLNTINGNVGRLADAVETQGQQQAKQAREQSNDIHQLVLAIQRLGDAANADRSTVKVTAEALEKQDQTRHDASQNSWTPIQRWSSILVTLAGVGTFIYYVLVHH
jgi:ATPase subunit of ABC transporter with duplicated ATPase domains